MRDGGPSVARIGQLRLRIPGHTQDDGRRLAGSVARELANRLPPSTGSHIGQLNLRLQLDPRASTADLPTTIAAAIRRQLNGGSDA